MCKKADADDHIATIAPNVKLIRWYAPMSGEYEDYFYATLGLTLSLQKPEGSRVKAPGAQP